MSYFPTDIPFMSDEELIENGLKKPYKKLEIIKGTDLVPVVRCKDCKHCYFADNRVPDEQGWVCEINSSEPVNLNGFCSYGERKEQKHVDADT